MINLFVIDDHFLIADGIRQGLSGYGFSVSGNAADVGTALCLINKVHVDVIILDLYIRERDPVENLKTLKCFYPKHKIVILSQENSLIWQTKMFQLGVFGYFSKLDSLENLAAKLQYVHSGQKFIPSEVREHLSKQPVYEQSGEISENTVILNLLKDGYEIKEIAAIMGQSQSSIDKKIKKLRETSNIRTNCQLIYHYFRKQFLN